MHDVNIELLYDRIWNDMFPPTFKNDVYLLYERKTYSKRQDELVWKPTWLGGGRGLNIFQESISALPLL